MEWVRITYNGGKVIALKRKDYLKNRTYWDRQQAIITEFKK